MPSTTFLFFRPIGKKQNGRPGLWLAETFSTSPLKPLKGIRRNLIGSKISTPFTKFVFVRWIGKTKWPPGLWFVETFSTFPLKPLNEFNKTWQEARSQHPLPGLRFRADQKNKIAALSSDWLRHIRLLLWNHWTEFNETWQKASSQRPLPSLCYSGWSKTQYGRPGLWLAETYFDFSSETAERNSAKLDRKQDLNVLYQVCVFRAEKWIKIATLANPSKKVAHFKNFFSPEGYSNKPNA